MKRGHSATGFTLVETLIALALLGAGILALASLQMTVGRNAAMARERMQALRHAERAIEQVRSFDSIQSSSAASAPGFTSFDSFADSVSTEAATSAQTEFTVARHSLGEIAGPWRELVVNVAWKDRLGSSDSIDLRTVLARSSPTRLAQAALQAPADRLLRPMARHSAIPLHAIRRDDGTSVLPWAGRSGASLVLDNLTAEVVGICRGSTDAGVATTPATRPFSAAADPLQACLATSGYLLSGYVGVSNAFDTATANAESTEARTATRASAAPLPPDLAIAFTRPEFITSPPDCAPMVTVADATSQTDEATRFYICLVRPSDHDHRPDTPMAWSARVDLWSAAGLARRTVCRYTPSADTLDNEEHPDTYRLVTGPLHNQNFVVTAPGTDCPTGTVLHQRL
ncbi:MAG: hypothetical protein JWQ11_3287 [Rhizobacter sp.]|nr:hypothetical protein [Rhizobacter sp.]